MEPKKQLSTEPEGQASFYKEVKVPGNGVVIVTDANLYAILTEYESLTAQFVQAAKEGDTSEECEAQKQLLELEGVLTKTFGDDFIDRYHDATHDKNGGVETPMEDLGALGQLMYATVAGSTGVSVQNLRANMNSSDVVRAFRHLEDR